MRQQHGMIMALAAAASLGLGIDHGRDIMDEGPRPDPKLVRRRVVRQPSRSFGASTNRNTGKPHENLREKARRVRQMEARGQ